MNNVDNVRDVKYNEKADSEKTYEAIQCIIDSWPDWKKEEYNINFAVSESIDKLTVESR